MLPIPGTSSPKHLDENVAAAALELPLLDFERLSAVTPLPNSLR
jgi:pyridoxine 4-dehydrogenase